MTGRERLVAASRGGDVDRQARLVWPGFDPEADAVVVGLGELSSAMATAENRAVLVRVDNPYGRALAEGVNLVEQIRQDPTGAHEPIVAFATATTQEIISAIEGGADGILYALMGASADQMTPMEYGGFFLEHDREILEAAQQARFNLLLIVGGEETYIDFVSDLPAHAFAWDPDATGFTVATLRGLRSGALAPVGSAGEIAFLPQLSPGARLHDVLTPRLSTAHV